MNWEVSIMGKACSDSWEIAVVHSSDEHGKRSYGWFGPTKLLVSHNGGPCRWPISKFVFDRQVDLAHTLCCRLNAGEKIV